LKIWLPLLSLLTFPAWALDTFYCPQHNAYISIGMSAAQVLGACGVPLSKQSSNVAVTQRVAVAQFIYTKINPGTVYPGLNNIYQLWSLPSGTTGVSLEINLIDNKVANIKMNGTSTNTLTLCGGANLEIGAPESQVYSACGTPTMINNTYVNQPVPSSQKPEVWVYQLDQFHAPYTLTFVNGKLESID
jgi:hypothetical protein